MTLDHDFIINPKCLVLTSASEILPRAAHLRLAPLIVSVCMWVDASGCVLAYAANGAYVMKVEDE